MDEQARELIQNSLDTTYLVEAGAGTGKTTLLVARIVNLIRSKRASLPQIVAITFTEKAAEELKTRIKKQLIRLLEREQHNANIREAYLDLEKSNINTIHGFCASILREYAIEAGLSPEFSVADPNLFHKFFRREWQEWLSGQIKEQNKTLYSLLLLGLSLEKLESIAQLFLYHQNAFAIHEVEVNLEAFKEELSRVVGELAEKQRFCIDTNDKGFQCIEALKKNFAFLEKKSCEQFAYFVAHGIQIKSAGNQKNWEPPLILKEIKEQLKALKYLDRSTAKNYRHNLVYSTVQWLQDFFVLLKSKKQAQAIMNFDDLLLYTRDLLLTNNEIRQKCQTTFRYLLVDEFQDTNDLQVEILFLLAKKDSKLVPGKLFMVGDPKQSIYRFRGADIEVYETVKETLGTNHCLFITRNFRSTHGIIHWCNQVFSRLITKPDDGKYQPQYTPLSPSREGLQVSNPIILLSYDNKDRLVEDEAKCISSCIRRIIDEKWTVYKEGKPQPCTYKDIAILFRRYTYVDLYEQVLSSNDIPYQVIGGKSSYNRIEVHSLLCLLKTIIDPQDTISLLATLRSPIFCISDDDILEFSRYGFDYVNIPPELENEHLTTTLNLLRNFHLTLAKICGYSWLQSLYQKTHIILTFASMKQGKLYTKTLMRILDFAKTRRLTSIVDWKTFVHFLSELESIDSESEVAEDAVSLFSIHRSKGLEFAIVILADVTAKIRELPSIIKTHDSVAIRLQKGLLETQNYEDIAEKEKKRLVAEEKRLLYVAATRARDYLLIPVAEKKQGFLEFLHEDIHSGSSLHVDSFHAETTDVSFTSMKPIGIEHLDTVSETKWFSRRQRWLASQKKTVKNNQNLNLELLKRQDNALELRNIVFQELSGDHEAVTRNITSSLCVTHSHLDNIRTFAEQLRNALSLCKKKFHILPFSFSSASYLVTGNIDIAFQDNRGFVMIDFYLQKDKKDKYYESLGTIYAYAVSELLNCMLQKVSFYFIEENEEYNIISFNFYDIEEMLQYLYSDSR